MQQPPRSTRLGRALLAGGAALVIASAVLAVVPGAAVPAAASDGGLTVSVSATEDLLDGQAIEIEVTAPAGQSLLSVAGAVRVCRDGVTYATDADLQFAAGNCPDVSISSSGSVANHAGLYVRPDLRSAVGTYRIGVGAVEWSRGDTSHQLACDVTHPCRLVVSVRTSTGAWLVDSSTLLTFSDSTALASCGGSATDALDTAGPDRFIDTWARWTRAQCEATGAKASTSAVLAGEGLGLDSFAAGDADLVYSATGATIPGRSMAASRPSISVPIAVNAAVLALVGGYPDPGAADWPIGLRRPFTDVRVTVGEMASLFGQGVHGFIATGSDQQVIGRNAQLAAVTGVDGPVQAPAASDAVTWITTRWFDTRAGDVWLSSPLQDPPSQPRDVVDELSAADPPFARWSMDMYSSRATLKKVVADDANRTLEYKLTWVLTDLATAEQLGLPVARIENSRGEFVAPTTESLAAAVAGVEPAADGTVLRGADGDAPGAYPLTFVEHAVVPAEPDCEGTTFETTLDWIDFITGEGQEGLIGLRPLDGDLAKASSASAARFAAACDATDPEPAEPAGPSGEPTTPTGPVGSFGGPGDLPSFGGLFDSGFGELGTGAPIGSGAGDDADSGADGDGSAEDAGDAADRAEVAAAAEEGLRPVSGRPGSRGTAGVGALVGLALMGAGAGALGKGGRRGAEVAGG